MLDRTVSSIIDTLNILKTFQLGVSLGCGLSQSELMLATVAAVLQVQLQNFINIIRIIYVSHFKMLNVNSILSSKILKIQNNNFRL